MASIQKRKYDTGRTVYRVQIRTNSETTAATFHRLTDAKAWAADQEAKIGKGRFAALEADRRTFAELIERYKSDVLPTKKGWAVKAQAPQLDKWLATIGNVKLSRVTPDAIERARKVIAATPFTRKDGGTERNISASTLNRYYAALQHCMGSATNWGWIERNPCDRVKKYAEPRGRIRFLSTEEQARLLLETAKHPTLNTIVLIALSSGARDMDIRGLQWRNVDLVKGTALVETTKNGDRRVLVIAGAAIDALRAWAKVRRIDCPWVFPSENGNAPVTINKAWKKALSNAGIPDFRFHDLRHCAASALARDGASLPQIGAVLGHKTAQMTQRYAHLTEQHQEALVRTMAARVLPGKSTA